jgi:hypothetical protein
VLCSCATLAYADFVTVTAEIPATTIPADGFGGSVEIDQFEPSADRILTQVDFDLLINFSGTMGFENTDPNVATFFQLELTWSLDLYEPNALKAPNDPPLISLAANRLIQGLVDPFDGELDFDGFSGRTFDVVVDDVAGSAMPGLTDPNHLLPFEGTGTVALPLVASFVGVAKAANTTSFESLFENVGFEGELSVTYTYVIPEPTLAGVVLLAGIALRRRR